MAANPSVQSQGANAAEKVSRSVQRGLTGNPIAEFDLWQWWRRHPGAMIAFFVLLGIAIVITLFVGSLAVAGELVNFYGWLVDQTNAGQPWTEWMRDHPRVFPPLAFLVFLGLGAWLVPWRLWAPAFLVSFVVFFLGFLGGHVYW